MVWYDEDNSECVIFVDLGQSFFSSVSIFVSRNCFEKVWWGVVIDKFFLCLWILVWFLVNFKPDYSGCTLAALLSLNPDDCWCCADFKFMSPTLMLLLFFDIATGFRYFAFKTLSVNAIWDLTPLFGLLNLLRLDMSDCFPDVR